MDGHDHHPNQDQVCLGLGLGLGLHQEHESQKRDNNILRKNKRLFLLDLSMSGDRGINNSISNSKLDDGEDDQNKQGSKNSDETSKEEGTSGFLSRKKLRLNRDQTALLEDSFREHSTLNTAQKMSLAEKLNLRPRQVEVWFQNRRARTKLKQTEIDCEFLKKKCEKLGEENRRLKKELFDLRSTLDVEKTMQSPSNLFLQHISRN